MSGKFGWSYPPGCSGSPADQEPSISEEEENVIVILEEADLPQEKIDEIMKIMAELVSKANTECPVCAKAAYESEIAAEKAAQEYYNGPAH